MKKRFVWVSAQGVANCVRILVDTETAVQYIYVDGTTSGGMTVLVGPDGKPLLHPDYIKAPDDEDEGGYLDDFNF